MGISDRDYVRSARAPGVGVGPRASLRSSMRMWSVNTWLIVICVGVFVLDSLLASSGVLMRVEMGKAFYKQASAQRRDSAVPATDAKGEPLYTVSRTIWPGATVQPLVDQKTGMIVGEIRWEKMPPLQAMLYFSTTKGFGQLEVWRMIGFQFLHANSQHLLFNMIGLFFFGGIVERHLGSKRYLAFYLVCGVFGAISYMLLNLLGAGFGLRLPGVLINDPSTMLIGASAGIFGVLVAVAYIAPKATILVMFILPMTMRTAAYLFVAIAAFNLLKGGHNAGGDAAHIGGAIAGYYFIRRPHLLRDFFEILGPKKSGSKRRVRSRSRLASPFVSRPGAKDEEIDRILAKVATDGLHSLSEREKRTLRKATEARR